MREKEILDRVKEIRWHQTFELMPGVVTNGLTARKEGQAPYFQIPENLDGKRVLDIGCAEGFFTFLAESRGASVVAIDAFPRRGFFLAREILGSKAEFHHMSAYDLHPDLLGLFDIVLFLNVYYHLKHPLWALERIASVTRDHALVESAVMPPYSPEGEGFCRFLEHDELNRDPTNWWLPDVPCLLQTIRAAGFPRVELLPTFSPRRCIVRARQGPRTAAKMLAEDMFIRIETPTAADKVHGSILVSGWAISKLDPEGGIERIVVYLDSLDDPSSELGVARFGLHRQDLMRQFADERCIASGFEFVWDTTGTAPGKHTLHILAEGKSSWHYRSVPIEVAHSAFRKRLWSIVSRG